MPVKKGKKLNVGQKCKWFSAYSGKIETGEVLKHLGYFGEKGHTYTIRADRNGVTYDLDERSRRKIVGINEPNPLPDWAII